MTELPSFSFKAIGVVRSPFQDKFGIPRQPGLVSAARGVVKLGGDPDLRTALRSLEEFSHIWIVFVFHEHGGRKWKPSVRPPRLGGAVKVGVLASRSPHRPNPVGMSVVALERVDFDAEGGPELFVSGLDLLDGTPVLDIKPYIPYADSVPSAKAGWASAPLERVAVTFASFRDASSLSDSGRSVAMSEAAIDESLRAMVTEVLEQDPRPAYQKRQIPLGESGARFGIEIAGHEVKYEIADGGFLVTSVVRIP